MRARMSLSAWIMSVPGAKSIDSSAAPRTDFERTRITPRTMLDRLFDRPRDGDFDVLDREARRLGDDDDPREGHLGIDAAGHAQHGDHAEGGQQRRSSARSARSTAGPGDQVDPAPAATLARRPAQRDAHASAPSAGLGFVSASASALGLASLGLLARLDLDRRCLSGRL